MMGRGRFSMSAGIFGRGIEGLAEVLEVDAVPDEERPGVGRRLGLAQLLGRDEDDVGSPEEIALELGELARDLGEGGELVDAVIDERVFAQRARDDGGRGGEDPVDGLLEAQAPHGAHHLEPQELPVDDAHPRNAVGRDGQRVEDVDVRLDLSHRLGGGLELVHGATEVRLRRGGRPVANRVDPENAVVPREDPHDVRLRERIAAEVVPEAEHVAAAQGQDAAEL